MKILWLCNIMLPKISKMLSLPTVNTGGWLTGLSNDLLAADNIELCVCFPQNIKSEMFFGSVDGLKYYAFAQNGNNEASFKKIISDFKPDLIHIFGTEYKHSFDMVNVLNELDLKDKAVINIQGLVSVIAKHYCANLPGNIVHSYNLRGLIKRSNIYKDSKTFAKKGEYEKKAISSVNHIIGRTDWDKACTLRINPNINYHFCGETLRDEFYKHKWDINSCKRHSIFISQCNYPVKGFHLVLGAMKEIVKYFPDAHIYTTGKNPLKLNLKEKIKQTTYSQYIASLIKKYNLENHVTFLGNLNEQQMCEAYLNANVFVSASSIENSPNSLGEAMLLGVPCVCSDVGGVKNMLTHNTDGFVYPFDEEYMLAYYVMQIFKNDDLAKTFSENASNHANITHNKKNNLNTLIDIYNKIIN